MSIPTITAPARDAICTRSCCGGSPSAAIGKSFAGITQPNEASNCFHRSFGFTDAGLYRRVAWKHDRWHDVAWMQLDLLGTADQDRPPGPIR